MVEPSISEIYSQEGVAKKDYWKTVRNSNQQELQDHLISKYETQSNTI